MSSWVWLSLHLVLLAGAVLHASAQPTAPPGTALTPARALGMVLGVAGVLVFAVVAACVLTRPNLLARCRVRARAKAATENVYDAGSEGEDE